jgi:hypothetical protein
MTFDRAITQLTMYGYQVIKILKREEPKATFTMQFLASCFGNRVSPGTCARSIIREHRSNLKDDNKTISGSSEGNPPDERRERILAS